MTTVSRILKSEESKSKTLPDQKKLNKSMSNMMENFTKHHPIRIAQHQPHEQESNQFINNFFCSKENKQTERTAKEMLTTLLFNVHAKNDP